MKAAFFSLFTLAAGAFAAATPQMGARSLTPELSQQNVTISTLTETVKTYTSTINSTIANLPENPTTAQQNAAVSSLAPQLEGITDTLHLATKAAATSGFLDVNGVDVLPTVLGLVQEIVFTVKAVVDKLGLVSGLLTVLKPLFIVLGSLVSSLDLVVGGLLTEVESLLDGVLSTVAGVLTSLI